MLRLLYLLALLITALPFIPGFAGLVAVAFSYLPTLGFVSPGFSAWREIAAWPGVSTSISISLAVGFGSTFLALIWTFLIVQRYWGTPRWVKLEKWLSPLMAIPHVAFAVGCVFLFAPSGMFARLLANLFGVGQECNIFCTDTMQAVGLTLLLAIKETPFLLLMSIAILRQFPVCHYQSIAKSLGYSHGAGWLKVILPLWLPKLRFPIYAVLAYSLSVVDIALIAGPSTPPTFAVLIWQWFNDPDLALLPRATAGAVLLFALCFASLLLYRSLEWVLFRYWQRWQYSGSSAVYLPGKGLFAVVALLPILALPVLAVWSFALRWRFPDMVPSRYSLRFWEQEYSHLLDLVSQSFWLATVSATLALILAIITLEYRAIHNRSLPAVVIATPLLVPQLSVLFGMQITTYLIPGAHYTFWVIWAHVLYAFPYIYLSLDGPWRSFDPRLQQTARSLGYSQWHSWGKVKLPLLLPAIILGWAMGMSVSLAQYLPTQLLGAGRVVTLTTEAVSLASGQDRRIIAIYGLMQAVLPLVVFSLAVAASRMTEPARRLATRKSPRWSIDAITRKKSQHHI